MWILPFAVGLLLLMASLLAASETALFSLVRMERTRADLSGNEEPRWSDCCVARWNRWF